MSNNKCYSCKYFKAYYTKGYKEFNKTNLGLCTKSEKTVEKCDGCAELAFCHYTRIGRKEAALAAVVENINLLAELKQILTEDRDEFIDEFANNLKQEFKK